MKNGKCGCSMCVALEAAPLTPRAREAALAEWNEEWKRRVDARKAKLNESDEVKRN